ncbi:MAG: trypsin-like peptidase domain-containing protein [Phycisphaerae bacterium]|nr:trypsin-like peptidase domain-containing protein [Phycisphaerae bacterium]
MFRSHRPVRRTPWAVAAIAVLCVGVGDRGLTPGAAAVERGELQATSDELAQLQADLPEVQTVSRAFRLVAKIARPGVVHIRVRGGEREGDDADGSQRLRERLKDMIPPDQLEHWLRRIPDGSASGIVMDAAGHILTNNHVVANRAEITVVLSDEREFDATIVGRDPKTDLAVVKIDAPDLHPLTFGDSDALDVGDWVIAVGSPFGLTQTVTHGIVSAKGRTRVAGVDIRYQDFIQTDAAINPGNSGGPLLNLRGEVVGVNTAIATHGDGVNAGIAFTIPSNMAVKIAAQLKAGGEVRRGYLGILPTGLTRDDVEIFGLRDTNGVLVDKVIEDSPAARSGLQLEDVIMSVNGTPVTGLEQFRTLVADLGPDESARLRIVRDRREQDLTVRLGLQPEDVTAPVSALRDEGRPLARLGLGVRTARTGGVLDFWMGRYDEVPRGVMIMRLDEQSTEAAPDVQPFEVVVGCNGRPVSSVHELNELLKGVAAGEKVRLEILEPTGDRRIVPATVHAK